MSVLGKVADGFDIVAIRAQHEGAVIVRVVDFTDAWRSIVRAAGGQRRRVKRAHLLAVSCRKGAFLLYLFFQNRYHKRQSGR